MNQPLFSKFPHFLHGGDYNPDQWLKNPEIIDEDFRLFPLANCNTVSVGIFAWAALEPEEGVYRFDFLDDIFDRAEKAGMNIILATPSGARPHWLAEQYPEVLRTNADRTKNLFGGRHNHCYTSPVYRDKTQAINRLLAQRYGKRKPLIMWHVSNEYSGECHCELCQKAFRQWLKERYGNDLDRLNYEWWNNFWSHTYTSWDQIESPSPIGENRVHALSINWKRFVTHQTVDFYRSECAPLREITPDIPVTTNLMGTYTGLDYWKFAPYMDIVSWDSYPSWHIGDDVKLAASESFVSDLNRSMKGGKPYILMESTPSNTNWQKIPRLKRPGMHSLSSLHKIAYGADSVLYFQWRKSRGSSEKFHGAVVDHVGHENTRVFHDVSELGEALSRMDEIVGSTTRAEAAVIYDWDNRWAIDDMQGLGTSDKDYCGVCIDHYTPLWKNNVAVDVIDSEQDFSDYKLLIAPMLYMVKKGVGERIQEFVENGGTFVATYASGMVNDDDLCFLGGFPGPLSNVLGIWSEEIDTLTDSMKNSALTENSCPLLLKESYDAFRYCDLVHPRNAEVLMRFGSDFYKGMPALTKNDFGRGTAYYMAFENRQEFLEDFYSSLIDQLKLKRDLTTPDGVSARIRSNGNGDFLFLMNFTNEDKTVDLAKNVFTDILTGDTKTGSIQLKPYGVLVLK